MKKNNYLGIVLIIIVVAVGAYFIWHGQQTAQAPAVTDTGTGTTSGTQSSSTTPVAYACADAKTIQATYGSSSVVLTLSDGRTITLPQVGSGSGIRYSTDSGTAGNIVFSSEGDNASLIENSVTTFNNCLAGGMVTTPYGGIFTDQGKTFSFSYPKAFTVSGGGVGYTAQWSMLNDAQTLGLILAQVTVPASFEPKTTFLGATLTVGTSSDAQALSSCTQAPQGSTTDSVTIKGVKYTKIVSSDAGAGNYYDTTSYRTIRNSQCYSLEYTIHSTNVGNYSPDQGISAFDKAKVTTALESIAQSFTFLK